MIKRVLLVDDDPVNNLVFEKLLRKLSVKTYVAENVQQALAVLAATEIHFIFTDYHLPIYSGLDLLHFIKEDETLVLKNMPVVLCTADSSLSYEALMNYGFNEVLYKPVDENQFRQLIDSFLSDNTMEVI